MEQERSEVEQAAEPGSPHFYAIGGYLDLALLPEFDFFIFKNFEIPVQERLQKRSVE